jgi:hypothetical protein
MDRSCTTKVDVYFMSGCPGDGHHYERTTPAASSSSSSAATATATATATPRAKGVQDGGGAQSASGVRRRSGPQQGLRSPAAKRPVSAPVALQGWLHKQGSEGLMLWKKRWFVLSEYCLFYYKGELLFTLPSQRGDYSPLGNGLTPSSSNVTGI